MLLTIFLVESELIFSIQLNDFKYRHVTVTI